MSLHKHKEVVVIRHASAHAMRATNIDTVLLLNHADINATDDQARGIMLWA